MPNKEYVMLCYVMLCIAEIDSRLLLLLPLGELFLSSRQSNVPTKDNGFHTCVQYNHFKFPKFGVHGSWNSEANIFKSDSVLLKFVVIQENILTLLFANIVNFDKSQIYVKSPSSSFRF